MLPQYVASHNLIPNFIVGTNSKFHSINNRLCNVIPQLLEKYVRNEISEKRVSDQGINEDKPSLLNNNGHQNMLCKLPNYFKSSGNGSVTGDCMTPNKFNKSSSKLLNNDLIEVFVEQKYVDGICVIHEKKINTYVIESNSLEEAKVLWVKGQIRKSIDLFLKACSGAQSEEQTGILKILQGLIFFSIRTKGKAVVQEVIVVIEKFCQDTRNSSSLFCVWYALFTSDMYEDWCLAERILKENEQVVEYLHKYIPWMGSMFLMNNELSNYQRLIETALMLDLNVSVGVLLRSLFSYYYQSGYYQGCSAVYKCCEELNITLTRDQEYKYLMLTESSGKRSTKFKLNITTPPDVKFKF